MKDLKSSPQGLDKYGNHKTKRNKNQKTENKENKENKKQICTDKIKAVLCTFNGQCQREVEVHILFLFF